MPRKWPARIGILLAAIFTVLFFTNDFGLIDIQKTAIIVSLGVDREADGTYEVTAQIAVPETDATPMSSDAMVSGRGGTVAQAIDRIGLQTGWYPKLVFCNLVVLGEETVTQDVMRDLDFFLRSDKIQGTCLLATAEGTAKELLSSVSPLDRISSFALQKILLKDADRTSEVLSINLKDFATGYFSHSHTGYMPYIRRIPTSEEKEGGGGGSGGGKSAFLPSSDAVPASGSGADGGEKTNYVFDASETTVFCTGVAKCRLTLEETQAYNFVTKKVTDTVLQLKDAEYNGKRADVLLSLEKNKYSARLVLEDGEPVFRVKLTIRASILNTDMPGSLDEISSSHDVPDDVLRQAEARLRETYEGAFEKLRAHDCDVFRLKEDLFRRHPKLYEAMKDKVPKETQLETDIRVLSMR